MSIQTLTGPGYVRWYTNPLEWLILHVYTHKVAGKTKKGEFRQFACRNLANWPNGKTAMQYAKPYVIDHLLGHTSKHANVL